MLKMLKLGNFLFKKFYFVIIPSHNRQTLRKTSRDKKNCSWNDFHVASLVFSLFLEAGPELRHDLLKFSGHLLHFLIELTLRATLR